MINKKHDLKVVILTQIKENRDTYLNTFGFMNQSVFATVRDAMYDLFYSYPKDSTISINKTSDDFAWITIEYPNPNEKKYFELRVIEPLSFGKNE